MPHRIIWSWYTGRWRVGCYIWYSEEGFDWAGPQLFQAHPQWKTYARNLYALHRIVSSTVTEWPVYNLDFKVMILFNVKGPTKIVQDNSYVGWTKLNRASAVSFLERILIIFGRRNNSSFTHFKGPFIATQLNWTQLNWPSWTAYSQSARSKSVAFCLWRHKRAVEFSWVKLSCVAINTP